MACQTPGVVAKGSRWAAVALLGAAAVAACSSDDGSGAASDQPASTTTTAATPEGPFAVGRRSLELVDESRPTDAVPAAGLAEAPDRTVPVEVVYPAEGEPTADEPPDEADAPEADAPAAPGRFPLLVIAHGFTGLGEPFVPLAAALAREGYVVALPTFPLSRNGVAVYNDYVNQPADMSFVVDELLARSDDPDDPLSGRVDGERIGVAGHSLGAVTVWGMVYNSCCVDERVDAAVSIAGAGLPYPDGDYDDRPDTPLLVVHGVRDETVSIGVGDFAFGDAPPPVWYLRLDQADHVSLFTGDDLVLVKDSLLAFFDAELKDDREGLDGMTDTVRASGRGEWRVRE